MSQKKSDTPTHLKHINREALETKKVVGELEQSIFDKKHHLNDLKNSHLKETNNTNKETGKISSPIEEIRHHLQLLSTRLDQPYSKSISTKNKKSIIEKIKKLINKDLNKAQKYIEKQNNILNQLESQFTNNNQYIQKKYYDDLINKKSNSLWSKLVFWWHCLINRKNYQGPNKPSISVLNTIENTYLSNFSSLKDLLSIVLDNCYSQYYFDKNNKEKASPIVYNTFKILAYDMSKAINKITISNINKFDIKKKINEIEEFAKIHLSIVTKKDLKNEIFNSLEILEKILENQHKDAINIGKTKLVTKFHILKIKEILVDILEKKDNKYSNAISILFNLFFQVETPIEFIVSYLKKLNIDYNIHLSPKAHEHISKQIRETNQKIYKNELILRKTRQIKNDIKLISDYSNSLGNTNRLIINDPVEKAFNSLLNINLLIQNFIEIFSPYINSLPKPINLKHYNHPVILFKSNRVKFLELLEAFSIKQDIINTHKKKLQEKQLFNQISQTELNEDDIKKIQLNFSDNANVYFEAMRHFENELTFYESSEINLVNFNIDDPELCEILKKIYLNNGYTKQIEDTIVNSSLCIPGNKQDQDIIMSPISYYAFIRFGQAVCAYLAAKNNEKTINKLLRLEEKNLTEGTKLKEDLKSLNDIIQH